jgi:hypothetical protein
VIMKWLSAPQTRCGRAPYRALRNAPDVLTDRLPEVTFRLINSKVSY